MDNPEKTNYTFKELSDAFQKEVIASATAHFEEMEKSRQKQVDNLKAIIVAQDETIKLLNESVTLLKAKIHFLEHNRSSFWKRLNHLFTKE